MLLNDKQLERFVSNINILGNDDCWKWNGRINQVGNGIFVIETYIDNERVTETYQAHILAYKYFTNSDPDARYFDRMCDNSLCCNPNHIVPRTIQVRILQDIEYDENGCWLRWKNMQRNGYTNIVYNGNTMGAHRVSYEIFNGEIPEGLMVRHTCHHRNCINPTHLRLGTHEDNMQDMVDARRQAKGSANGNSVLNYDDVVEIKKLLASGEYYHREIAKMFNCSRPAITDIAKGKTWNWVK